MAAAKILAVPVFLVNVVKQAAFEPVITGLVAYTPVNPDRLINILKVLVVLGAIRRTHHLLNELARNHWGFRNQGIPWDFSTGKEVCVVTGGCSGFGLLTSKGLASKAKVVVLDIQDLPTELKDLGVSYYKCDIASASAVSEIASRIRHDIGTPTILMNNAAVLDSHTILDTEDVWLEKIIRINLMSHFTLIREFLPGMLEQRKGHILTMASLASFVCVPNMVDYSCTKAGVMALHEGLASELKHLYPNGRCIQTSIIYPQWAQTPLIKSVESSLVAANTPVLPPAVVSDIVIKQILSGKSGQIVVPAKYTNFSGFRGWPSWMQEGIMSLLQRNSRPVK